MTSPNETTAAVRDFDAPKVEALIEIMFLAAASDGDFGVEERRTFAEHVASLTGGRVTPEATGLLLVRLDAALAAAGRPARLAEVGAVLGDTAARTVAFTLAVRVVAADGIIRTSERELLLDIAEALDLDRDLAADLVRDEGK